MAFLRAFSIFSLMLQGIQGLGAALARLTQIRFVFFWLVAVLFLLFNGTAIYGNAAGPETTRILLMVVALALAFTFNRGSNPLFTMSTAEFGIVFGIWTMVGIIAFKFLQPFNPETAAFSAASVATLVTHALVVAIGEESIFRGVLPKFIPAAPIVAQLISAIIFGAMHFAAYSGSFLSMGFAALLGFFFGAVTVIFPRHGLVMAMAFHFTWNSYTLGYF